MRGFTVIPAELSHVAVQVVPRGFSPFQRLSAGRRASYSVLDRVFARAVPRSPTVSGLTESGLALAGNLALAAMHGKWHGPQADIRNTAAASRAASVMPA